MEAGPIVDPRYVGLEADEADAGDITVDDVKEEAKQDAVGKKEEASPIMKAVDTVVQTLTSQLFFCCMVVVILAAWGAPWVGKKGGPLRTEYSVTYGVNGLVFFISGLSLKTRSLIDAFLNMRLNLLIQSWVFGFTPGLFYVLYLGLRQSEHIDHEIADGFCLLGCLPMTINMCYVLTSSSNGNDSSALFNATFGNIIGIFLSPLLILGMLSISGGVSYEAVILKLTFQVVCPLVAGQILLNAGPESFRAWLTSVKKYMKLSQEALLSLVVYASFCNTFASDVDINPVSIVIIAVVICVVQFGLFALAWWFYKIPLFGFDVKDSIAGMFCSVHKTMALGVPVISSMYENSAAGPGVYSIPLLIYHPLLAVSGSILVPIMKKKVADAEAEAEKEEDGKGDGDGDVEVGVAEGKQPTYTYGVLGASGNVGAHVVQSLLKTLEKSAADSMVVFGRDTAALLKSLGSSLPPGRVTAGEVDMRSPESVKAALLRHRAQVLFVSMPQALSSSQMVACGQAIADAVDPSHTAVVRLSSHRIEATDALPRGQGSLGQAHVASEAALVDKGVATISVRPVSFFSNFDRYDLPALVEGLQSGAGACKIASPLGHGAEARVNWVSTRDIGAVAAACMVRRREAMGRGEGEGVMQVSVTGGEGNSFSVKEYCAALQAACRAVMSSEAATVECLDLPLPDVDEYADLWTFLRAGGFDHVSSAVQDWTGEPPEPFSEYVQAALRREVFGK